MPRSQSGSSFVAGDPVNAQQQQYVSSTDVVGIAVGSAIGGAVFMVFVILVAIYIKKRRHARRTHVAGSGKEFKDTEKGVVEFVNRKDSITTASGDSHGFYSPRKVTDGSRDSSQDSPTKVGAATLSDPVLTRSTELANLNGNCDVVPFSDIELIRTIGEGSYGLVWLGRYLQTTVAVKVLTHDTKRALGIESSNKQPSEGALMALHKEASIMAALRHPNCVQYLGCCLDPPALVMEYCSRRSVDKILAEAREDPKAAKQLDWVHVLGIATDAAKGMLYLHSRCPPIVHRDLKSPNLLVDALWHVKVTDFNLSRALDQDSFVSSLQITNPRWLAPEILRGEHGGQASDVYSFGVVLWELLTWRLPWGEETNPFSIINIVLQGRQLRIPDISELPAGNMPCYDEYVSLVKRCWEMDPNRRPTMDIVVQELRSMLTDIVKVKLKSSTPSESSGDE